MKQFAMTVASFSGQAPEFVQAMQIRTAVFVEEQSVPVELERDEFDAVATHVLLRVDDRPAGTGRIFHDPQSRSTMRLGRVAVLKEFRGRGLGNLIVAELLRQAENTAGCRQVLIHAQKQVEPWYAAMGFVAFGDEFVEAGIVHREMIYALKALK